MRFVGRVQAERLRGLLRMFPAVLLLGPRQCGKSTLARRTLARLDTRRPGAAARPRHHTADLEGFLDAHPRRMVIDEAQRLPEIFPALRHAIDQGRGREIRPAGLGRQDLLRTVSETLAGRVGIAGADAVPYEGARGHAGMRPTAGSGAVSRRFSLREASAAVSGWPLRVRPSWSATFPRSGSTLPVAAASPALDDADPRSRQPAQRVGPGAFARRFLAHGRQRSGRPRRRLHDPPAAAFLRERAEAAHQEPQRSTSATRGCCTSWPACATHGISNRGRGGGARSKDS